MGLRPSQVIPSIAFISVALLLRAKDIAFHQGYSLNLASLDMVKEARARAAFGQSSPYDDQLYMHAPLVHWGLGWLVGTPLLFPLFLALSVASFHILASALGIFGISNVLFSILYFGNPFLYLQIMQLDTRILDLFLTALFFWGLRRYAPGTWIFLGLLTYLRTHNFVLLAALTNTSPARFLRFLLFSMTATALLLASSFALQGNWVFSSVLPPQRLLQLQQLRRLHELRWVRLRNPLQHLRLFPSDGRRLHECPQRQSGLPRPHLLFPPPH